MRHELKKEKKNAEELNKLFQKGMLTTWVEWPFRWEKKKKSQKDTNGFLYTFFSLSFSKVVFGWLREWGSRETEKKNWEEEK